MSWPTRERRYSRDAKVLEFDWMWGHISSSHSVHFLMFINCKSQFQSLNLFPTSVELKPLSVLLLLHSLNYLCWKLVLSFIIYSKQTKRGRIHWICGLWMRTVAAFPFNLLNVQTHTTTSVSKQRRRLVWGGKSETKTLEIQKLFSTKTARLVPNCRGNAATVGWAVLDDRRVTCNVYYFVE